MNDLIDRRAAIDAVKNTDVVVLYHDTEPVEEAIEEAIEATKRSITTGIEGLPSAQPEIVRCKDCKLFGNSEQLPSAQPEIIRCKDCKWYGRADKRRFYRGMDCLQKRIDTIVPDKDFCSRAERRTDE